MYVYIRGVGYSRRHISVWYGLIKYCLLLQVRFHGRLFYHEGWPFCINEKVVLQLAPLHKVRLKQGDFYLQVVPLGRKAAKLVIKCLSASGQAIAEIDPHPGEHVRQRLHR